MNFSSTTFFDNMSSGHWLITFTDGTSKKVSHEEIEDYRTIIPGEDRHGMLTLDPGIYRVSIQTEETPDEVIRQVAD